MSNLERELSNKGLTQKQVAVASLVSRGLSNKEIAKEIDCKEQTVKFHLKNIFKRLNLRSRAQLVVFCLPYMEIAPAPEAPRAEFHGDPHVPFEERNRLTDGDPEFSWEK